MRPWLFSKFWIASRICLRLFVHVVRAADSRTRLVAGTNIAIAIATMAMTTRSSVSVNPRRVDLNMACPPRTKGDFGRHAYGNRSKRDLQRLGERRGVSPTWNLPTSGLRFDARLTPADTPQPIPSHYPCRRRAGRGQPSGWQACWESGFARRVSAISVSGDHVVEAVTT